jgi:thiol:disulfide interchange protein DsbC
MKSVTSLLIIALPWLAFSPDSMSQSDLEDARAAITKRIPLRGAEHFATTPIEGLYEVAVGGQVLYVSKDGRYALSGRLIDLETREDLTERVLSEQRLSTLENVAEDQMIIFESEGDTKHTLTTFTDIDCPYCRKMHSEMGELNRLGIRVRYLLFPRAGEQSVSYEKAVSVWCAEDQLKEMTLAKAGNMPQPRECENPVKRHMSLARRLGLTGTPFSITDTGRVVTGYMPAPSLYASMEADKAKARR